jgi:hypothetical protein
VLTLRLEKVAEKLIHSNQTAFMKNRNIMSGVMVLHEILHETKMRKQEGIILKIDFEKAYDKVKWKFLFECLAARGFSKKWCNWIEMVVFGGTVSVRLNNLIGPYIKSFKGVRQGDPLSPLLFNFVADGLARMVNKAQSNGLICGLISHIIDNGVPMLQYADDTIVCLKHDFEGARNMKLLLYMYELMAGLKINFHKSEIITINDEGNLASTYAEIFNCKIGTFPIKYLGVPVSPSRLHVSDWLPLTEKSAKKLDIWKGGLMSIAGRSTLISSSLNNSAIYHMSIYLLPKSIISILDKTRRTFFWQGGGTKRKYHLIKWPKICKHKRKGGLGIKDIRKMNINLLCKWWRKLEVEDGLWQQIVRFKYLNTESICTVSHRQSDSPIWSDLLKIKNVYLQGRKIETRNGKNTLFWLDSWLYDKPLDDLKGNWEKIMRDVDKVRLKDDNDLVLWQLGGKGKFSVSSVYNALSTNDSGPYHKMIWKGKIPAKIKNFLWLVTNNAILTKDNLIKRKWTGSPICHFCDEEENISHLFFQCSMAKAVWAVVAHSIGADNVPRTLQQCWSWCERWLPHGKKIPYSGYCSCLLEYLENSKQYMF